MKYWQKIYFSVLLLFVLVCNVCIFLVVRNMLSEEQRRQQHFYLREAASLSVQLEEELAALETRDRLTPEALTSLMQGHGDRAKQQERWVELTYEKQRYGSNFPFVQKKETVLPGEGSLLYWWHYKEGCWYFNVCSSPRQDAELWQLFAVRELAGQEQKLIATGAAFAVVSPLVLAGLLYLLLQLVNRPIARLSEAARRIAAGDYELRIPTKKEGHRREKTADEMQQLAADFNTMAAAVQEKVRALEEESRCKQEFIDNMAHEMRTPLTMITGFGQLLSMAALEEREKQEALEKILAGATRLTSLQEQLLALSLLRTPELEKQPVSLKELLLKVEEGQRPYAAQRGVQVHVLGQDVMVQGEKTLLYSLFDNLLHNALRASGAETENTRAPGIDEGCLPAEEGPLTVRMEIVSAPPSVRITDRGIGMTKQQLARIGEPFYRGDKARSRRDGGAGLGVTLCFAIAKAHGATLQFESCPGAGTRAIVRFTE